MNTKATGSNLCFSANIQYIQDTQQCCNSERDFLPFWLHGFVFQAKPIEPETKMYQDDDRDGDGDEDMTWWTWDDV